MLSPVLPRKGATGGATARGALAGEVGASVAILMLTTAIPACGSGERERYAQTERANVGASLSAALGARRLAEEEVERLRPLILERAAARSESLSAEARAEDQWKTSRLAWGNGLRVGWTARGAVTHLWSWAMRIPVSSG
jgi:hypothetical protein